MKKMGDFMATRGETSSLILLMLILTFSFDKDVNELLEELKDKDKKLYNKIKNTLDKDEFKNLFKNFKKDIDITE